MKLKHLTGAIRPSEWIEIIEVTPFMIEDKTVFKGTLYEYFSSDFFKKYCNKYVLSVKSLGEKQMQITIYGGKK